MTPHLSLVIPVFNEAGNILPLLETAIPVLRSLAAGSFEIIVVNDGSSDGTASELEEAMIRWPECRIIEHPENQGQSAALLDGLRAARGELILTMDGDGQNDPRDFPTLARPVEAGELDLACGWRQTRRDSWIRRVLSRVGNAARRAILGDGLHDGGCQLRVMRKSVVNVLFPVELMQSFLPAIAVANHFRVAEFPVSHHPRVRGKAHFGLRQLWWKPLVAMFRVRKQLARVSQKT
jgi:dolichol-phosphate mannosyltransferase